MELRSEVLGAEPEMVLVLELAGSVDAFRTAVKRIEGLEWLVDFDLEDLPPDEDFFRAGDEEHERALAGQLFLVMSNEQALHELLSLWSSYSEDPEGFSFGYGRTSLRDVFLQLRSMRLWGPEDRLQRTGVLRDWAEQIRLGQSSAPVEIELWFRQAEVDRRQASEAVRVRVETEGGEVTSEVQIPEIGYHALMGRLPRDAVQRVVDGELLSLVRSENVMFFSPVGQSDTRPPEPETLDESIVDTEAVAPHAEATGDPIIALLDGLPLENHPLLAGHLTVDDPLDWASAYQAGERRHGTWMASLIVNGDLNDSEGQPSALPTYCRPVLQPDPSAFLSPRPECAPRDRSFVDLVHEAIVRIFDGTSANPPAAPSVRIVNFSIGERARPYEGLISPLARLLDWLSLRYGVLFCVSAGNHDEKLHLGMTRGEADGMSDVDWPIALLSGLRSEAHIRRILSPAESINALTVGSAQLDIAGTGPFPGGGLDPLSGKIGPSPITAIGPGIRRAIKPDLLLEGGRQLVRLGPGATTDAADVLPIRGFGPPGQLVAAPTISTAAAPTQHTRGTSNAAALASRLAGRSYEQLSARVDAEGVPPPSRTTWAPLLKALVAHCARWGAMRDDLLACFPDLNNRDLKTLVTRLLGYGFADSAELLACTDERVLLVGWGEIDAGDGHLFELPIPDTLAGVTGLRRLTSTLGWTSPINPRNRRYRSAAVWFDLPSTPLEMTRQEADWQTVQRGTLQHEILEGLRAATYDPGYSIPIRVNCRSDAGGLDGAVPYGLAVTFEVAPEMDIPLYEEIAARIRPAIRVGARPAG
jgi:hypothetical protein